MSRQLRPAVTPVVVAGVTAGAVVLIDVVTKRLADARLPGAPVELGIGRLRLSHNTGVAFSLGDGLPSWLVLGFASAITAGVAVAIVLGWLRPPVPAGLMLGGAVGNVVDRAGDGMVTDFLAPGWFPTFNLADTAITLGALALLWAAGQRDTGGSLERRADPDHDDTADGADTSATPRRPLAHFEQPPRTAPRHAPRRTTE